MLTTRSVNVTSATVWDHEANDGDLSPSPRRTVEIQQNISAAYFCGPFRCSAPPLISAVIFCLFFCALAGRDVCLVL